MKINSVHLVTMFQMESKNKIKLFFFFSFPLSDNINRKIYQKENLPNSQSCFSRSSIFYIILSSFSIYLSIYLSVSLSVWLSIYLSIYVSIYLSIYPSIHPFTHAPIFKVLFDYTKHKRLLSTFHCCGGLSANLYIHWLKTQAIVYELLYFDMLNTPTKGFGNC